MGTIPAEGGGTKVGQCPHGNSISPSLCKPIPAVSYKINGPDVHTASAATG